MGLVFLNGEFLPAEEARVSVLDRGFLLGDGVYEVIPAYHGCLFRLQEHLQRLQNSLDAVRITNPLSEAEWQQILTTLVEKNAPGDQSVYLQVTRGVAKRDHAFPEKIRPTVFAMSNPIVPVDPKLLEEGVEAITLPDSRWLHCNIKAISLLPNVLLRQQAVDQNKMEAILIHDGLLTEGAASNVLIVDKGVIKTPPKSSRLLPGVTRDLILELAAQHAIPYQETDISQSQLQDADEIWLSSSTREILPVTRLNEHSVGEGKPGPLWHQMRKLYRDYKASLPHCA